MPLAKTTDFTRELCSTLDKRLTERRRLSAPTASNPGCNYMRKRYLSSPNEPNGHKLNAFSVSYSPLSRSILALLSLGQGNAKRSGRSAIQYAVKAIKVAF